MTAEIYQLSDYRKQDLYLDERTYPRKRYEAVPFFWSTFFVACAQANLLIAKMMLGGR